MTTDKLFLAWNCSNCAKIKTHISKIMFDDSIMGSDGQSLTVIHTFSNNGTRDILDVFDLGDNYAPVLLTHKEKIIDGPEQIITYLKASGFIK